MKQQLLKVLDNSRNYTLAVAEAMPAERYSFQLVKEAWNFSELLNHMAYGIGWWEDNFIKGKKTDWNPPTPVIGKQEVMHALVSAYDSLQQTISGIKENDDSINGFHATIDHITHHRGQAVLHLRANKITPPEYTY